jgi:uncharacterized damage-inducible protein DinB
MRYSLLVCRPRTASFGQRLGGTMRYSFLVDTYETERLKVMSVWSMFRDEDLGVRPHMTDRRGRNAHEHMVHQCVSENLWFHKILGIDVGARPLPEIERRTAFIREYGQDSARRLTALRDASPQWWEETVPFFDVERPRTWVLVRRIAHTAHHRGQQTTLLRILGRDLHSTYGPTADTGGLPQQGASTIYAYRDENTLLAGDGRESKTALRGHGSNPPTERPAS